VKFVVKSSVSRTNGLRSHFPRKPLGATLRLQAIPNGGPLRCELVFWGSFAVTPRRIKALPVESKTL